MKRFYTLVSTDKTTNGFRILLDGRAVKTSSKVDLVIPNQSIADAVMREWVAQEKKIIPNTMPLTQILNTKIDRVSQNRTTITEYLVKYFDTDLLCYRADFPPALAQKQQELWQPWLEWFEKNYGFVLKTTTDLIALKQDDEARAAVLKDIDTLNDDLFTILQLVASIAGSLVLGLSFIHRASVPKDIIEATFLEEHFKDGIYNAEKYGQDPMQEKQQKAAKRDLDACFFFLKNV